MQASNLASEIARANQRNDELWQALQTVKAERDALRAEVERLQAHIAELENGRSR